MWIDRAAGGGRTQRSMLDELGGLPPRVRWAVVCLRLCLWCLSMEGLSPPVEVEVKPNCPAKRHFPGSERWTVGMLARAPRILTRISATRTGKPSFLGGWDESPPKDVLVTVLGLP